MNNTQLFKLFNSLLENINSDNDIEVKKFDFTKKEDLDKFAEAVNKIKTNAFFSNFFNSEFLDECLDKAKKIYKDAEDKKKKEEAKKRVPTRPSLQVPINVVQRTKELANKYLNTMVMPYAPNITTNQAEEIKDSLVEFACWVYKQ